MNNYITFKQLKAKRGHTNEKNQLLKQLRDEESDLGFFIIRNDEQKIQDSRNKISSLCEKIKNILVFI